MFHRDEQPQLALALGGGGLRGMAHLGVLAVLEESGLAPAAVAGTSIGSLVAALWACGWTAARMERVALRVRLSDVFDPLPLWSALVGIAAARVRRRLRGPRRESVPGGLYRGERLERLVEVLTDGARLEELERPVAIVAADLLTRRPVVFVPRAWSAVMRERLPGAVVVSRGSLARAVRASAAIPAVFPPLREGRLLLADGGLIHPVPAQAARAFGALRTVAVMVPNPPEPVSTPLDVIEAGMACMTEQLTARDLAAADVVIRPEVESARLHDLGRVPRLIRVGREAARAALPALASRFAG